MVFIGFGIPTGAATILPSNPDATVILDTLQRSMGCDI